MDDDDEDCSTSIPDINSETSRGSSVSVGFINEYEELLKYAIVAPRFNVPDENANKAEELKLPMKASVAPRQNTAQGLVISTGSSQATLSHDTDNDTEHAFNTNDGGVTLDALLDHTLPGQVYDKSAEANASYLSNASEVSDIGLSPETDKDLLLMDERMDEWCLQVKRNVMNDFVQIKMKVIEQHKLKVNELQLKHQAEIKKLNYEIQSLKELLFSFEKSLKQKDDVISNMTESLSKQQGKSEKIRVFSQWRIQNNTNKHEVLVCRIAEKHYQRTLLGHVWSGWRSLIENRWKQRVEKACQAKSQQVCLKLTEDYEERIHGLQCELESARNEISKLHQERESYEETMKKAFMRGVCALNMEAMTMFREGGEDEDRPPSQEKPQREGYNCSTKPSIQVETHSNRVPSQPVNDNGKQKKVLHVSASTKKPLPKKTNQVAQQKPITSVLVERHVDENATISKGKQQRPLSAPNIRKTPLKPVNEITQGCVLKIVE